MRIFLEYLLIYFFLQQTPLSKKPIENTLSQGLLQRYHRFSIKLPKLYDRNIGKWSYNGESFHVGVKGDKGDLCSADCCFYRRVNAREIFSDKLYLTQSEISVWEYYYYWLNQFMMTAQWGLGWLLLSSFSTPRSPLFICTFLYFILTIAIITVMLVKWLLFSNLPFQPKILWRRLWRRKKQKTARNREMVESQPIMFNQCHESIKRSSTEYLYSVNNLLIEEVCVDAGWSWL